VKVNPFFEKNFNTCEMRDSMYERFQELCRQKGISISQACKEIGIKPSAATNWKTRGGTATVETCQKIADYFQVSIDYIMTGEIPSLKKPETPPAEDKATQLYSLYQKASPEIQKAVELLLKSVQ
jgi:transcriptional regulator with XRE-family HTH domain